MSPAPVQKPTTLQRVRDVLLLVATGVLLLFAQSAFWLNHTIFDKQTFTSIVTPILQAEDTRQAIASAVTEKAFQDNPVVNRLIGKNVTALVAGLLGTDLAQQLTSRLVDKGYTYLTTDNPQPIAIDLEAIKTPLEKLVTVLEARGREVSIDPSKIPDSVELFDPSGLPDIYGYSVMVLWLGPLCWIGALLLAVLYIYLGRRDYPRRVYTLGGVIILAACIGLLVGPLLPPPIVAQVPIPGLRGVVQELINAFLAPFTQQMIITIVITALALLVFSLRFAILRGAQWIVKKTADAAHSTKAPQKVEVSEQPEKPKSQKPKKSKRQIPN